MKGKGIHLYYNHNNVKNARQLRKDMTPWERKLWFCCLNRYPVRFTRQKSIGKYIVDFYCAKARLAVELDGGGHYNTESQEKDNRRTVELEQLGIKELRFCNIDIDKNMDGVFTVIDLEVKNRMNR